MLKIRNRKLKLTYWQLIHPAAYFKVLRSRAVKPTGEQANKNPFKTLNILFNYISGFNPLPHNCILNAADIDICKVTSGR